MEMMKTASKQYNMDISGARLSPNTENKKNFPEFFLNFLKNTFS